MMYKSRFHKILTGFVVQGHIFKVLLSHMCEEMKVILSH